MTLIRVTVVGLFVILGSLALSVSGRPFDECPHAVIICEDRPHTGMKYRCYASYHFLRDNPIKLRWGVSHGKIIRTKTLDEITVDARHVKTKTILVTLKVHWKNLSVCDKTATNTLELP